MTPAPLAMSQVARQPSALADSEPAKRPPLPGVDELPRPLAALSAVQEVIEGVAKSALSGA